MEKLRQNLIATVDHLANVIGQRCHKDLQQLRAAAAYIEGQMTQCGCEVRRQPFAFRGNTYENIIAEVQGTEPSLSGMVVIGAHYDSAEGTPGADDNASGVAGLLELARLIRANPLKRTAQLVAFCLEEPPAYMTKHMGSYVHAKSLHESGARVHGMISLEMLGFYCDRKGCQYYPSSLFQLAYPSAGNFIAFVGNFASRRFLQEVRTAFAASSPVQSEALTGPSIIPGVDFSDHRNYWKFGYPAFMLTDTAFYRNPNYHDPGDTSETLDYERIAEVVMGLYRALGAT